MRKHTFKFEKDVRNKTRKLERDLSDTLVSVTTRRDEGEDIDEAEIASIKRELAEIELSRAQKIIFRARCNWAQYGERSSKYFLNLEKRKSRNKVVAALRRDDGSLATDPKQILQLEGEFFAKLYTQDNRVEPLPEEPPFIDCPKISDLHRE